MENTALQIFENEEFGSVRIIEENGKYLFCGSDVAKALGYSRPNDAINAHCRYTVKCSIPHPQNIEKQIEMAFIPEGDVYRLITHSKMPDAERFEKWVFDEVLPSIRKHGGYIVNQENLTPEQLMAKALIVANSVIENQKKELAEAQAKIALDAPLVEFAEQVGASVNSIEVGTFAKICQDEKISIGRNKLFSWFRNNKFLKKNNEPYQKYMEYFEVTEYPIDTPSGSKVVTKTLINGRGQLFFVEKLKKEYSVDK